VAGDGEVMDGNDEGLHIVWCVAVYCRQFISLEDLKTIKKKKKKKERRKRTATRTRTRLRRTRRVSK